MVSFQGKLTVGLKAQGYEICFSLGDQPYQAVLVIGGTRDLVGLWRARRKGIPIIQRLDGMNWIHRKRWTGLRHYLRSEYGNLLLAFTRSRLADRIVYQSFFAREWWERVYGPVQSPSKVVYNGVDLKLFSPDGPSQRPSQRCRVLLVEGSLGGGYEAGLETALKLGGLLQGQYQVPIEMMVVGKISPQRIRHWQNNALYPLVFTGVVEHEMIPEIDRSAHLLFAADLNAACPNSVIEALACGLPVIAYDTGALPELISGDSGRVVPYGGNPWNLESPDLDGLARAAVEVWQDQPRFRTAARQQAEAKFDLSHMVEGYLDVLNS